MYVDKKWRELVDGKTIHLLMMWLERRGCLLKASYFPSEVERHIVKRRKSRNNNDVYDVITLRGIECSRSTAAVEIDNIGIFGINVFARLNDTEQIVVISYIDPLNLFSSREEMMDFLKQNNVKHGGEYERVLELAMIKLQRLAEEKGLVRTMAKEGEIRGWDNIAKRLGKSVPTAMKLAREMRMPITMIGGEAFTTETLILEFLETQIKNNPYWKDKKGKRKGGDNNKPSK